MLLFSVSPHDHVAVAMRDGSIDKSADRLVIATQLGAPG